MKTEASLFLLYNVKMNLISINCMLSKSINLKEE